METLPSVLALGKTLLLLFVGDEEDDIGRRQNKLLVQELGGVVELGGRRMEPYAACWIHLYAPMHLTVLCTQCLTPVTHL